MPIIFLHLPPKSINSALYFYNFSPLRYFTRSCHWNEFIFFCVLL